MKPTDVYTFSVSRAHSKQLLTYRTIIFSSFKPFSVPAACEYVDRVKDLQLTKKVELRSNLECCFTHIRQVNLFIGHVQSTAKTAYNPLNSEHIALLSSLWESLMPQQRLPRIIGSAAALAEGNVADGVTTNNGSEVDWGLIGFQGRDPGTDFRDMG